MIGAGQPLKPKSRGDVSWFLFMGAAGCPLYPRKRTFRQRFAMSKADISRSVLNVRQLPKADIDLVLNGTRVELTRGHFQCPSLTGYRALFWRLAGCRHG